MKKHFFVFFLVLTFGVIQTADAQLFDKLKKKVESEIKKEGERRVDEKIKEGVNKGYDEVENAVSGEENNESETPQQESADEEQTTDNSSSGSAAPSLKAYSKYDFVPGDQIILYEDFSQDAVGDFPALWTTDAAGEINTLNIAPGNWFNLNSGEGTYWFLNEINFPTNFILELDIVPKSTGGRIAADLVFFGEQTYSEMDKDGDPGNCGLHIVIEKENWRTEGYKEGVPEPITASSQINPVEPEKVNHVIVWVQNRRLRIYNKGAKVLDVPTNIFADSKFSRLCFKLYRGASCGAYISNIKITTASPDMRSKLLTEGKIISYGIYFDVNKDIVKPESYGSLKEIASVLNENPGTKIMIIGHTDADGNDADNLDLSKRRAASVKNALVKDFGIDASLIETDGKGESEPVAKNDTAANKALNRRVEFIKM
jgi:outer membrane protein OmpA-like peptidoglycan-associated protein